MCPHTRLKLETALIKYDRRQSRSKSYNRYALGIYLKVFQEVIEKVDSGFSLARALYDSYNGRLLTTLEKSVGLPPTYGGGAKSTGRPA